MLDLLIDHKVIDYHNLSQELATSITYQLLIALLRKKFINKISFCLKYYISEATFQRRKKKLNQFLAEFSLQFTQNRLVGSELNRRFLLKQLLTLGANFNITNDLLDQQELQEFSEQLQKFELFLGRKLNQHFATWLLITFFQRHKEDSDFFLLLKLMELMKMMEKKILLDNQK